MEGITKTILDLTSAQLTDASKATELHDILQSRDPVRLVTTRSLFAKPPLALVALSIDHPSARTPREATARAVFDRERLPEARGVLRAITRFAAGTGEGTLQAILAATGHDSSSIVLPLPDRGLLLASASRVDELVSKIRSGFAAFTGGLSLNAVVEPLWPDEALLGRSPDLVRPPRFGALLDALARRREPGLSMPGGLASIPGFIQRCGVCHVNPATARDAGDGEFLCDVCGRGRQLAKAEGDPERKYMEEASEVESMLPAGRPDGGVVAMVAAWCDGIAPLVVELGGLDQVSLTARAIDRAITRSVDGLVERLGLGHRHQSFTLGVGAAMLVVPAGRALDVVRRLVEGVESGLMAEADGLGGYPEIQEGLRKMRLRVGMCFAPVHFPLASVVEMALALGESADRLGLKLGAKGETVSTIDFWVLRDGAPFSTAVDELRHQVYESRREARLSRRPYAFPEFKRDIIDVFRVFRRIPRPEVLEVRRLLVSDLKASDINFRWQLARSEEWKLYATEAVGRDPARWDALLFRPNADGVRETSLIDLIELTEFTD